MPDLTKQFENFYLKLTSDEKKIFIEAALTALTKPLEGAHVSAQELNKILAEELGCRFSRGFQKKMLEKLGYKKNVVNGKVVYTGVTFRKQAELKKNAVALLSKAHC